MSLTANQRSAILSTFIGSLNDAQKVLDVELLNTKLEELAEAWETSPLLPEDEANLDNIALNSIINLLFARYISTFNELHTSILSFSSSAYVRNYSTFTGNYGPEGFLDPTRLYVYPNPSSIHYPEPAIGALTPREMCNLAANTEVLSTMLKWVEKASKLRGVAEDYI